jgi:hypothetical protein
MKSLRWGAAAAVGACVSLAASGFGQQAHAARSSREVCGQVSGYVGSVRASAPIPACTVECFIMVGPVNANYGAVGVDIAPCVEG